MTAKSSDEFFEFFSLPEFESSTLCLNDLAVELLEEICVEVCDILLIG